MEHFDISDMFGRRTRPRLELTARSRSNGNEIIFGLKNIGRAVARAPYLAISCPVPFHRSPYGIDGNGNEAIKMLVADNPAPPWRYPASADYVIHPGVTLEIGCLTRENNVTPLALRGRLDRLWDCVRGNATGGGHNPTSCLQPTLIGNRLPGGPMLVYLDP